MKRQSRCNARNLKSLLCRAKVSTRAKPTNGSLSQRACQRQGLVKCHQPQCNTCPFMKSSANVTSSNSSTTVTVKEKLTCTTPNVIYCISCLKCCAPYVVHRLQNTYGMLEPRVTHQQKYTSIFLVTHLKI